MNEGQDRWGKIIIGTLLALGGWKAIGEDGRSKAKSALNQTAQAFAEASRELERRRQQEAVLAALQQVVVEPAPTKPAVIAPPTDASPVSGERLAVPTSGPVLEPDAQWRQRIVHPSVVLILGKRGSGKSALAYRLLELMRFKAKPYVVGAPASARSLLPDWIGLAKSLEELPPRSVAILDEAYLTYHARASSSREARSMSQTLNLSRQRDQTLIFVSQEARQVDRNIASSASVVVFKDLGILQLEFERHELGKLVNQAKTALATVQGDRRRWSYVYAPDTDFMGLLENELPSFWKPALSRVFADLQAAPAARSAKTESPSQKAQRAHHLHEGGASYGEIASALGVSKATVLNYLKGYPYRR